MTTPIAQPPSAIFKDEKMCCGRVAPSGAVLESFLTNVFATVAGPGRVELLVSFITSQHSHQTAMNRKMERTDSHQ